MSVQKAITDKSFHKILAERRERHHEFFSFLLAAALALSISISAESNFQEKNATVLSEYLNGRLDEVKMAYNQANPIEKLQVDLEIEKINSQIAYYGSLKKLGILSSILIVVFFFVFITGRGGYEFSYFIKGELLLKEGKGIENKLKVQNLWHPINGVGNRFNNQYYYVGKWHSPVLTSLHFTKKAIIVSIPDNLKKLEGIFEINKIIQPLISKRIKDFKISTKHNYQNLDQGFFSLLWFLIFYSIPLSIIAILYLMI